MILDRYPGYPDASDPRWDRADADQLRLRGLRALGYWSDGTPPHRPNPGDFVDPSWDPIKGEAVFVYLFFGEMLIPVKDNDWCRFNCGFVEPPVEPITDEDIDRLFLEEEAPK